MIISIAPDVREKAASLLAMALPISGVTLYRRLLPPSITATAVRRVVSSQRDGISIIAA